MAHTVTLTALTVLFYLFAAGIAWCAFVDTAPPLEIVSGDVVNYDRNTGTMIIEWSGFKNRHCTGSRSSWIRTTAPEPPARTYLPLGTVPLPPEGFSGRVAHKGVLIHWRVPVTLGGYVPQEDFVYQAEWEFSCNPVQAIFPLRVQSPFVQIHR